MDRSPTTTAEEDEISADMLDQIPDIHPTAAVDIAAPQPVVAETSTTLQSILMQMQQEMEAVVAGEFARIESSMTGAFAQLESRLQQTEAELAGLREENAALVHAKDRYDRAFQAIKELTEDIA